jgi:hypothetical protein
MIVYEFRRLGQRIHASLRACFESGLRGPLFRRERDWGLEIRDWGLEAEDWEPRALLPALTPGPSPGTDRRLVGERGDFPNTRLRGQLAHDAGGR